MLAYGTYVVRFFTTEATRTKFLTIARANHAVHGGSIVLVTVRKIQIKSLSTFFGRRHKEIEKSLAKQITSNREQKGVRVRVRHKHKKRCGQSETDIRNRITTN